MLPEPPMGICGAAHIEMKRRRKGLQQINTEKPPLYATPTRRPTRKFAADLLLLLPPPPPPPPPSLAVAVAVAALDATVDAANGGVIGFISAA